MLLIRWWRVATWRSTSAAVSENPPCEEEYDGAQGGHSDTHPCFETHGVSYRFLAVRRGPIAFCHSLVWRHAWLWDRYRRYGCRCNADRRGRSRRDDGWRLRIKRAAESNNRLSYTLSDREDANACTTVTIAAGFIFRATEIVVATCLKAAI